MTARGTKAIWVLAVVAILAAGPTLASYPIVGWGEQWRNGDSDGSIAVAARRLYSLALRSDRTVVGWGNGVSSPSGGLTGVVAIAAGSSHSLALKSDDPVVGWGDDYYGQSSPLGGLTGVVAVGAVGNHSLALKSDTHSLTFSAIASMPIPTPPHIYIESPTSRSYFKTDGRIPVRYSIYNGYLDHMTLDGHPFSGSVIDTANLAFGDHTLQVTAYNDWMADRESVTFAFTHLQADDVVVGWGERDYAPPQVLRGLNGVVAIAAGYMHSLALRANGTVVCWGANYYGEIIPPQGLTDVVAVDAGTMQSIALKSNGTVVGWGERNYAPPEILNGLTGVVAICAGWNHSLGLKSDGTVVGWGDNSGGKATPPSGLTDVVAVAASESHSLAMKRDGTVVGWGYNDYGGATPPPGLTNVVAISAGYMHSLALKSDGTIVGWGRDDYGQATPPQGLHSVVAIGAGDWYSLALRSDGTVVGWGDNYSGQTIPPRGLTNVTAISAGTYHSLALRSDAPASHSSQLSSLAVAIQPIEAVSEGGRWRCAGTTVWRESGEVETGISVGVYRIEFKDLSGWVELGQLVYVSPLATSQVIQGYRPYRVGEAKRAAEGPSLHIAPAVVSAAWDDVFYVEVADRSSGIRVEKAGHGLSLGTVVTLFGVVRTNADGERYVDSPSVTTAGSGSVEPLGMRGSSLGGGDFGYDPGPPEAGQRGVTGGSGLNNIGLLVRAWGRIVERDPSWFTIDDGSGVNVRCLLPSGVTLDPGYTFVGVTGISSCEKAGAVFHRLLRVRVQEDIASF